MFHHSRPGKFLFRIRFLVDCAIKIGNRNTTLKVRFTGDFSETKITANCTHWYASFKAPGRGGVINGQLKP